MQASISTITLCVDDLDAAVTFYRDGLGLPTKGIVDKHGPLGRVAFFQMQPGLKLALWPRRSMAQDTGLSVIQKNAPNVLISHNVAAQSDVEMVVEQACRSGATLVKAPGPAFWGGWTAYFQDPDGHLWEIVWNPG